jgi:hypothetical protein
MPELTLRLVLLHHAGRQARAASFDVAHRAVLTEAAAQPHHALVELDTAKLKALGPDVPAGKLGTSGKPDQLPLVLPGSFQRLLELAKVGALVAGAAQPNAVSGEVPPPWSNIAVGATVLASEAEGDGWWECIVLAVEGINVRLRWRDYPDLDYFNKSVTQLGLMSPSGER